MNMKIAVYPGSFDPLTNGHLDILKRALNVFDKVILLLAVNPKKKSVFTVEERLSMMKEAVKDLKGVEVDFTDGLTVAYAKEHGAFSLIRGLRAVSDFEYEFQLSAANSFIDPDIDMVFFMAKKETTFVSSSMINQMFQSGVDIKSLVPEAVLKGYQSKKK
jgi:pantetheine-phosphate adenylyltransferase